MSLPRLNLPPSDVRISENEKEIWDPIRKKWVALLPEEWVRQNFINYLVQVKKYPRKLLRVEENIKAFGREWRCDIVAYSSEIIPLLIVECKAPDINVGRKTFDQVALYNSTIKAPYLIITNGLEHYCCKRLSGEGKYTFLDHIPVYSEII